MKERIILHSSFSSPFSEQIKLMLNFAELDWVSVIAPKGVPRPIQQSLVGNYSRRIPILQIGADAYCDSAMIMNKIAELSAKPYLSPIAVNESTEALINKIANEGTKAMLGSLTPWNFIWGYIKTIPFKDAIEFLRDRKKLVETYPQLKTDKTRQQWQGIAQSYLADLNEVLATSQFLLATDTPKVCDFMVYAMIWYHDVLTDLKLVKQFENVVLWYQKMKQFDRNDTTRIEPEWSLEVARSSEPTELPEAMLESSNIGKEIEVPINDYLGVPIEQKVEGILVGENEFGYVLQKQNSDVGKVNLHIPKRCLGACG